jgi:hypothetical protein
VSPELEIHGQRTRNGGDAIDDSRAPGVWQSVSPYFLDYPVDKSLPDNATVCRGRDAALRRILARVQLEEPLKIYPVSNLVNSPKTDDPRCIEPVRVDGELFERQ